MPVDKNAPKQATPNRCKTNVANDAPYAASKSLPYTVTALSNNVHLLDVSMTYRSNAKYDTAVACSYARLRNMVRPTVGLVLLK